VFAIVVNVASLYLWVALGGSDSIYVCVYVLVFAPLQMLGEGGVRHRGERGFSLLVGSSRGL